MRIIKHMSWSLKGILKLYEKDSMDGLLTVGGKELNDAEARQFINDCIEKGYKCMPLGDSDDCPDFDYYGGGCPGHRVEEESNHE